MGERGNIEIDGVWLYTHWTGHKLKAILKSALIRGKGRWVDTPYLTRIIFCEMVKGDEMGLTGFGISSKLTDNNYPVLVVDVPKQEVREVEVDKETWTLEKQIGKWTFNEFVGESK
jgi:hypothetical protein